MTLPAGVFSAVAPGKTTRFSVLNPVYQVGRHTMAVAAKQGSLLKYGTTSPSVDLAVAGTTECAGILGDGVYDPAAMPDPDIANNIFAQAFLNWRAIGSPVTVWKKGEFFVTLVSGSLSYQDYIVPATVSSVGGYHATNTTTNPFKNGTVICYGPNTAANGPITVFADLV